MTPIRNILRTLKANADEFRELCETNVCSPDLLGDINRALKQGSSLSANIDTVMNHLMLLKGRLENHEES